MPPRLITWRGTCLLIIVHNDLKGIMMKWLLSLALCLLLQPSPGSAGVIDFESLPDSVPLLDQLAAQGVTFQNAVTLTAGLSLNEADFPPHSGVRAVGDDGNGPMRLMFAAPIDVFSAYFTYSSGLSFSLFDSLGALQNVVATNDMSNLGQSTAITINMIDVARIDIAGGTPESFIMDDLAIDPARGIPEPGTLDLFGLGLFALACRRAGCKRLLGALFALALCGDALADRGVFASRTAPEEVLIHTNKLVTVSAEIGGDPAHPPVAGSMVVIETDSAGQPLRAVGLMYDDGTHGDETIADTVYTMQFALNSQRPETRYYRVSVAYSGIRNRYLSPVMRVDAYPELPASVAETAISVFMRLQSDFNSDVTSMGYAAASAKALGSAQADPNIGPDNVNLTGPNLSLMFVAADPATGYVFRIPGLVQLADPASDSTDGAGRSTPGNLPAQYKSPGNDRLLIFGPGYNNSDPQRGIVDHALNRFADPEYMSFDPHPVAATTDADASLEMIKRWGDYGTVIMHTHGGLWSLNGSQQVVLVSGTPATFWSRIGYMFDLLANRIGVAGDGRFVIYPSFITKHASNMKNTFFYLGACESLQNDTLWNALKGKGAKVAFGWSETVNRAFNTSTFGVLIDPMLPQNAGSDPQTAQQAYDGVAVKVDPYGGHNARLTMRSASAEWNGFLMVDGGLVNGDFETGDWTGWTHGADPGNLYGIISGAARHGGHSSATLGRWDTAFTGQNPTLEPLGMEWIYQDFTVPSNATKLSFWWWMETYDTAVWDWFDAALLDTNGVVLAPIVVHGGKPGRDFGPYWNSGAWQYAEVDVTAYRGRKIRIQFSQRLDGYGDQTRSYIDDVKVE